MNLKIIKSTSPNAWYSDNIGKIYNVGGINKQGEFTVECEDGDIGYVNPQDCEFVDEPVHDEVRKKFQSIGVMVEVLDRELIDLLYALNFVAGLKTSYSCFGHEPYDKFYFSFDDAVSDEEIMKMADYLSKTIGEFGWFNKSVRYDMFKECLLVNWGYDPGTTFELPNDPAKLKFINRLTDAIEKYKK